MHVLRKKKTDIVPDPVGGVNQEPMNPRPTLLQSLLSGHERKSLGLFITASVANSFSISPLGLADTII